MRIGPGIALGLAGLLAGCGQETTKIFVHRAWPTDQAALVFVTDTEGAPLAEPLLLTSDAPVALSGPTDKAFRIRVWTYDASADLVRCGVRFGGPNDALPSPRERWLSPPLDAASTSVELAPDTAPPSLDLHFDHCSRDDPCDVAVRALDVPPMIGKFTEILALSEVSAIFAGVTLEPKSPPVFGRIDGDSVTFLPEYPHLIHGSIEALAWDGRRRPWMLTTAELIPLTADGLPTSSVAVSGHAMGIEGDTGAPVVLDAHGDLLTYDAAAGRLDAFPDAPQHGRILRVVSSERIALAGDPGWVAVWDGAHWTREIDATDLSLAAFVADEEMMMLAVRRRGFYLRDEVEHIWNQIDDPFGPFVQDGVSLGSGRALVVGDGASAAIWSGGRWCRIPVPTSLPLYAVSLSPDGRRAFIAGGTSEARAEPVLLAVDLSP